MKMPKSDRGVADLGSHLQGSKYTGQQTYLKSNRVCGCCGASLWKLDYEYRKPRGERICAKCGDRPGMTYDIFAFLIVGLALAIGGLWFVLG